VRREPHRRHLAAGRAVGEHHGSDWVVLAMRTYVRAPS
jgi:hypothetical protein